MRSARRGTAAAAVGAAVAVGLAGCTPGPPPVPVPSPAAPIAPGGSAGSGDADGVVPANGTSPVDLVLEERAAVVIGATSTDEEDLTLRLVGEGVDLENDDGQTDTRRVFDFEQGLRDPMLAVVLEAGEYTIEVGEWSGDRSGYRLQVLTGTTTVSPGTTASFGLQPGAPGVAIVPIERGDAVLAGESDIDTVLWAYAPESDTAYSDDDSGGDRNPRIELLGEEPQELVVVLAGYADDARGAASLIVE
ncbi:hypothetical protein [Agrococcus sp. Marseille-P2731]|uniref:hypothetical protein n=1 Tax=Agrococcus sp. Marseille-P2731 TaxID=1841862 RepID=UPI0011603D49|nr:hypothetical protein [Agrococcus sp. Marseille-P2731]